MLEVLFKSIRRIFLLIIVFLSSLLLVNPTVYAKNYEEKINVESWVPRAAYSYWSNKTNGAVPSYRVTLDGKKYERDLHPRIYYAYDNNNNVLAELYCVEQGLNINEYNPHYSIKNNFNFRERKVTNVTSDYENRKNLISQIISVGYKVSVVNEAGKAYNKADYKDKILNNKNVSEMIAVQQLIWEVARGERNTLKTYYPNERCVKSDKKTYYCPFYHYLQNNKSNSKIKPILDAYNKIIEKANKIYNKTPYEFSPTKSNAKTKKMNYDGKYFVLKLNNVNKNYQYFDFGDAEDNHVWIETSNNNDTIIIKSSKVLEKPVLITASFNPPKNKLTDSFVVYNSADDKNKNKDEYQALAIGTASANYYLKVQTPDYQIKIIKKDSITGKALAGVKFAICSKNTCDKSSIITTVTTDNNGVATYNKITKPATYYIKEISVPPGYKVDSKVISIKVTTDNVAGSDSFAIIEVKNSPKEFNLIKYTVDENGKKTKLNSDCGTDKGPIFELQNSKGEKLYFTKISNGVYNFSNSKVSGATTSLTTCNGEFKVYTLTECNYKITEVKAPEGLTLPSNPSRTLNVCGSDKTVSFINGLTGLEFQKKDEDGNFISGGKFSLQMKVNNVYKDMLLKKREDGNYLYVENLKDTDEGATYELITDDGIFTVSKLPPGEYRVVEKEAPEGYELVKDKDSKALVTITDENKDGYYITEMINHKVSSSGSNAFAELVITIITGRKVINYVFIISSLLVALTILLLVRRKLKKK